LDLEKISYLEKFLLFEHFSVHSTSKMFDS
jgi:hypothetical protein